MTKRKFLLACTILLLAALIPIVVYAATTSSNSTSKLDSFLSLREATTKTLNKNVSDTPLPNGIKHNAPPRKKKNLDFPGAAHIKSVVNDNHAWSQNSWASHELTLAKDLAETPTEDIAKMIVEHYSSGLDALGLASPTKTSILGHGVYGGSRATCTSLWHNANNQLVVTFSVVVDKETNAAHVHRFLHEQYQ